MLEKLQEMAAELGVEIDELMTLEQRALLSPSECAADAGPANTAKIP
jgi:hypothetical protein